MTMFDLPEPELTPAQERDAKLDRLVAEAATKRKAAERARNARRRGSRVSHPCPACGRRTFRTPVVMDGGRAVDERCGPCVKGNKVTGVASAWAEQATDRARADAVELDTRRRCKLHPRELTPCALCAAAP